MEEKYKEPLEYEKVSKLLTKYAIPSIIAMLVSALYNIVDQIFIGQGVGVLGNAATNVTFPLTTICTAIAL
ncbi:MATE family efflux transporter, partial [Clostridioides difficile]|nr:MATE family efflux transporter [Clostridioides difficile]